MWSGGEERAGGLKAWVGSILFVCVFVICLFVYLFKRGASGAGCCYALAPQSSSTTFPPRRGLAVLATVAAVAAVAWVHSFVRPSIKYYSLLSIS